MAINSPEIFADRIFYFKNVLENPREIVDLIESTNDSLTELDALEKWTAWRSNNDPDHIFGQQKQTRKAALATSNDEVVFIYTQLETAILEAAKYYEQATNTSVGVPQQLSISKYFEGASMGPHVDWDEDHARLEPIVSAVMYLNDDYEGGELHFKEQLVTIKPEAGSIVIFPSVEPFYHQSKEIISGSKYMSPIFWYKNSR